jgi:hypothetical protein
MIRRLLGRAKRSLGLALDVEILRLAFGIAQAQKLFCLRIVKVKVRHQAVAEVAPWHGAGLAQALVQEQELGVVALVRGLRRSLQPILVVLLLGVELLADRRRRALTSRTSSPAPSTARV